MTLASAAWPVSARCPGREPASSGHAYCLQYSAVKPTIFLQGQPRTAVDVLREAGTDHRGSTLVFPGSRPGAMLGDKVMTQALTGAQFDIVPLTHEFQSARP